MITFTAHGLPKGQPRPRAFVRGNRAAVYDPGTAEGWKAAVAVAAQQHLPAQPLTAPLRVSLVFNMPRPSSHWRTGRFSEHLRPSAPEQHASKPDADNLAKAVLDALTGIGMWRDDSQIVSLTVVKRWAPKHGRGGVEVVIQEQAMEARA